MLFTYAVCDSYLKEGGTCAFLITAEAFKSKGAGEGFRAFVIPQRKVPLKVLFMEDMVDLKPFQAANKTALFALRKGEPTRYPVPASIWSRKKGTGSISSEWSMEEVRAHAMVREVKAYPIDPDKPTSAWQTAESALVRKTRKIQGKNPYRAYRGASTEPYGVFWLRIKEVRPDGLVVVENMTERGKRKIATVSAAIEKNLIYPAVAGADITKFGIKSNFYVLISQDPKERKGYEEEWMISHVPLTYAYLAEFKDVLLSRGSRVVRELAEKTAFYSMFGIGEYTFAKYRVVWKRMAYRIEAVVLSRLRTPFGPKTAVCTDTTSLFAVDNADEAHYLCGILNSTLVDSYIRSFSSAGRGFGAPSVMENLAIPKFDPKTNTHMTIALLSKKAHEAVQSGKSIDGFQSDIDRKVEELWNIRF